MNPGNKNALASTGIYGPILLRLRAQKVALVGLSIILILMFSALFAEFVCPYNPHEHGNLLYDRFQPPDGDHYFGTDKFGRDVFTRVIYGGRTSLIIAIAVVFISSLLGLIYGTVSGYLGGRVDAILMRLLDFLLAFPLIFLLIMIIAFFEMHHWYLIPILGLSSWMETARLVRAEVLSIKERPYIMAARGLGYGHTRIMAYHIVPNCIRVVLVIAPLKLAEIVLLESSLSFLGIGVQPPTPSWGSIINDGRAHLLSAWWISTFPGIFITITVMGFHLLSDGLKKSLQPPR